MKGKKSTIIAIIFIIIGLIISIFAYFQYGWESFSYNSKYGTIGFKYDKHNYGNNNKILSTESFSLDSFNNLDIDLEYTSVEILPTKDSNPKIEIEYRNKSKVHYSISNNTLSLNDEHYRSSHRNKNPNIIKLFIPENTEITSLECSLYLGELKISGVTCKKSTIETNLGSIHIKDSNFENTEISLDLGEFVATNTILTNTEIENNLGSIEISGQVLGYNEMSVSMGAVNLNLKQDKDDTKIIADTDLGYIDVDGVSFKGISEDNPINPTGSNIIEIETNMGSIDINFK
ncbi:DUF4097 family beta strand repeat-containing protein [Miniphocaeibacter halophilus]|uniref:DUF4097 family beta strand repeat protein n=1 Tax=Miniphocaeibacter halophilus TaxID=2931922 RepID=A0AC61MUM1_9FIRM|nr:DUF4097 family beta strand repeat-containing protein [Miniphocaeibacter halophilus]QQK07951.1 DUF4097 family beta strand repeat protein [Miniphocaeibacter halophilus]